MTFDLEIPTQDGQPLAVPLEDGELLFVLGANGTGKSSLVFHFAQTNAGRSRKISAHRQTCMNTDALDMTPAKKLQTEQNIQSTDQQVQSRYRDDYAAQRASMTIYELIDAENVRARQIAALVDDPPGVPILPDQTGQLGAGPSRHLGQVTPDDAPVRLAQAR